MAKVWLARDPSNNYVVVKEPKLETNPETNIRRIRVEWSILKSIRSEYVANLVAGYEVLDKRVPKGFTILVIEYVDGPNLNSFKTPMDWYEVRRIIDMVARGLEAAHLQNIIHRDLKPSNVLWDNRHSRTKIIDFGTAQRGYERAQLLVMSPGGWTAPEQLLGAAIPQSDVWSIGALALYLLTGRRPCEVLEGYPCSSNLFRVELRPRLPERMPGIDDEAMEFLRRTLAPDPSDRFASATEVLQFLKHERTTDRPGVFLKIKGRSIEIRDDVIIGRTNDPSRDLVVRDNRLEIYDPNRYISKDHAEIRFMGGAPFIRDLGSLNGTAIYRRGRWSVISKGYKVPGDWVELRNGDIVSFAYSEERGPYLVALVRIV